jgi:hypothetical protein
MEFSHGGSGAPRQTPPLERSVVPREPCYADLAVRRSNVLQAIVSLVSSESRASSDSRCSSSGPSGSRAGTASVVWGVGFVAVLAALSTACTHVKPYERGKLAHPTMATDDITGPAESHMRGVQEGAAGGSASAESGCGCN